MVERLHIEEPEPPAPVTEPEKTFEEVLDEHPVSVQVNGQWQTFPKMCIRDRIWQPPPIGRNGKGRNPLWIS